MEAMNTHAKAQNHAFRFFTSKRPGRWPSSPITPNLTHPDPLVVPTPYPEPLKPKVNLRRSRWITPPTPPSFLAKVAQLPHRFSLLFRQIFENRRLKSATGASLAALAMLASFFRANSAIALFIPFSQSQSPFVVTQPTVNLTTKASLSMPLDHYEITQGFSFFHPAIDLGTPVGSPIHPIMPGTVSEAGWSWFGYGNTIVVNHHNGYTSRYAHLSRLNVTPGQFVTPNTIIGLSGSTGHSTGPHLHLEITDNGLPVNPQTLLN